MTHTITLNNLHRKMKTAFRDMKRAESDHDYQSAKEAFCDLSRALADMKGQDIDYKASNYMGEAR